MYDPRFNIDGQNIPVVMPPAFGLRHVAKEIYTGDGPVSYWNAYVAITQMHGHGHFVDPRIGVDIEQHAARPRVVEARRAARVPVQPRRAGADRRAATTPRPRAGARRCSMGPRRCTRCHPAARSATSTRGSLHSPAEVGQDPAYALRSATKLYRTTPLRGLWHPPQLKGPYFHDGKAKTLEAAVAHYVTLFQLSLTDGQKRDLVEYLKTL